MSARLVRLLGVAGLAVVLALPGYGALDLGSCLGFLGFMGVGVVLATLFAHACAWVDGWWRRVKP